MLLKAALNLIALVVISIFLYFLVHSFNFKEIISFLTNVSLPKLAFHYFISIAVFYFWVKRWEAFLKSHNLPSVFHRLVGYRLIDFGISYLVPSGQVGGAPLRATVYSRREDQSIEKTLTTVVSDKFVEISTTTFFMFVALSFLIFQGLIPLNKFEVLTFVLLTFMALIFGYLYYQIFYKKQLFSYFHVLVPKFLKKKVEEFEQLLVNAFNQDGRGAFYQAATFSFVSLILFIAENWTGAWALGVNISLSETFILVVFLMASYLIPLPANLGSLEAASVLGFQMIGLPGTMGLAYAVIIRLRDFIYTIIGASLFYFYHLFYEKNEAKQIEKS